ncbi:hypothetical protein SAMN02745751_03027 [Dethiosulfatibacter aminovorans DSM 17477]|uniref:Uncharacterized protein n=1 Tax=Dethiosulfatibacter aminovorans DSM 17477 TaxID=1121476 RepID=A0A1M6KZY8_9FIRM|nr:hypothetical protein [Dethiosulfatibacter aminovorans]SHJ64477.1 hypothetical protein SAMN02745751_03027 [Dethiosulfatibacter aminovorans DSM 17477]
MIYRVHKFQVGKEIDELDLERYLNELKGEVVSIIPNIIPKFHMMGATAGYDCLLIIEKDTE